jgi:hypothetical protein
MFQKSDHLVQIRNESMKDCDESYSNQELYLYAHIVVLKTKYASRELHSSHTLPGTCKKAATTLYYTCNFYANDNVFKITMCGYM